MKIVWSSGFGPLLALLALPVPATPSGPEPAAPADPEPAALRWPQVAAMADRHPLVLEAAARADGALGAVSTARQLPNPVVGLSVGDATARDGAARRREWSSSIELPLDFLAGRAGRVAAAEASADGARHDARGARARALRELRRAFVALAHGQAAVESGAELERQVAQLAALVRKRAGHGESRPSEVPRVEIELERLRSALERSRAAAEAQRRRLAAWLGFPVARVEADLSRTIALPELDELRQRAIEASPAVMAARARLAAAAAEGSAERWERLPRLSLGAARTEELDRRARTLTATISLPLWSWNGGRIRQAEAALDGERARLDALSRELEAALAEAWQGCAAGQAASRRFRAEILPRAESSARLLGRAFELGEAGLLDVLDAGRVLLDTRREYLDLLLDMQNGCGDLAALAGLELP